MTVYVAEIAGGIDDVADELFEVFDFCWRGVGLEFVVLHGGQYGDERGVVLDLDGRRVVSDMGSAACVEK